MQNICVYCGSSTGSNPEFLSAAVSLGRALAQSGQTLIYGGACVGLMGAVADAVLDSGGKVIGVIPESLVDLEVVHKGLSELHVVKSMHERKALMASLSDSFIAMPGGIGTIEEFLEICTWGQLGLHSKSYGLLNISRFFDPLLAFLDSLSSHHFLRPEQIAMIQCSDNPTELLSKLATFKPSYIPKWINQSVAQRA